MKIKNFFSSGAILATLFTLLPGVSHAFFDCNPCSMFQSCGENFTIGADAIWWKPCISDLDFAATRKVDNEFLFQSNHLDYERICPGYEWGVRGYFEWSNHDCGWGLRGSYAALDFKHKSSLRSTHDDTIVVSPVLHPFLVNNLEFSRVNGKYDMDYQEADLLLTCDLCEGPCYSVTPYFGVAALLLNQNLKLHLSDNSDVFGGSTGSSRWDSDYKGIGLRMGSSCEYAVCDCLKFFAFADGTLLYGKIDNNNHQFVLDSLNSNTRTSFHAKDDKCCQFVPGYHIGTGFTFDFDLCGCEISARFGYEFIMWHNIPNHRVFTGDNNDGAIAHSTSPNSRTLGFQGAFGGLSIGF